MSKKGEVYTKQAGWKGGWGPRGEEDVSNDMPRTKQFRMHLGICAHAHMHTCTCTCACTCACTCTWTCTCTCTCTYEMCCRNTQTRFMFPGGIIHFEGERRGACGITVEEYNTWRWSVQPSDGDKSTYRKEASGRYGP